MTVHRDSAAAPTRWARNVLACELGSATSVSICSLRPHRTPLWGVFAGGHRATDERCVHFWGKCHMNYCDESQPLILHHGVFSTYIPASLVSQFDN